MEKWKEFLDKEVKVVYEDGDNHFSTKRGKVIEINDTHLILKIYDLHEAINLSKILRAEEVADD